MADSPLRENHDDISPNIDVFKTLLGKYEYIERLLALQNDNVIKLNEKWEAHEKQL